MKPRLPGLTFFFAAAACALALWPGAAGMLQLDRTATGLDRLTRGLTAHLVHFSANHLAWDVATLLLLGTWAELLSRRGMLLTVVLSAGTISAAVWFFQPQFPNYRGLSGIDSALFGFAVMWLFRRARASRDAGTAGLAVAAVLLFVGKSAFELLTGSTLFAEPSPDFTAVPLAHLVGFATGAWVGVGPVSDWPRAEPRPGGHRPALPQRAMAHR